MNNFWSSYHQDYYCCSVAQSCPTLCNRMDCSMPGLCSSPSPEVCPSSCPLCWWYHPAVSLPDVLFSFCPLFFPASGTFSTSQLFTSDDLNTGVSTSASVLPTSIQGWFPLRLTDLTPLLSKALSGVFSSTIVRRHQSLVQRHQDYSLHLFHDFNFPANFEDLFLSIYQMHYIKPIHYRGHIHITYKGLIILFFLNLWSLCYCVPGTW